jgi:hypothetical protein
VRLQSVQRAGRGREGAHGAGERWFAFGVRGGFLGWDCSMQLGLALVGWCSVALRTTASEFGGPFIMKMIVGFPLHLLCMVYDLEDAVRLTRENTDALQPCGWPCSIR